MELISYNKQNISALLNLLKDKGIKTINLDFDKTLLKVHLYKEFNSSFMNINEFIKSRNPVKDFGDYQFIRIFAQVCKLLDIKINIVSFGLEELIRPYLEYAEIEANIYARESLNLPIDSYGKNSMLNHIINISGDSKDSHLLIDDDRYNVFMAKKDGYFSYHIDHNFGFRHGDFLRLCDEFLC
jgi:hypothetical protein